MSEPANPPAPAWRERAVVVLAAAASLVPVALLVLALVRHALDVPLWDEWELVPLAARSLDGTLGWGELWAQHNEHRIFFPRLWLLAIVRATGGSVGAELAGNVAAAGLLLFLLARNARKLLATERSRAFLAALPFLSWIVFSQAQWENWVTGWQIQIWLAVLCAAVAAFALVGPSLRRRDLALALAAALVGTFSFADGVLTWPVLFLALQLRARGPDRKRTGAIWLTVGALAVGLYLLGYRTPPDRASPLATLAHPLRLVDYVLRFLGAPLASRDGGIQRALGVLGLLVAAVGGPVLLRKGVPRERLVPWLALALWAVGCAVLAGLGRAGEGVGMGPAQAKAPRYVTLASPLWVCDVLVLLLAARHATGGRFERLAPRLALAVLAALVVVNSARQGRDMTGTLDEKRAARDLVVSGDLATASTETLAALIPDDDHDVARLRARAALLREHRLGPCRGR